MNKTITLSLLLALGTAATLQAKPNMVMKKESLEKMAKMAGEASPYYRAKKEAFPKDYFLASQNLPFLVGVALFHPESDRLKLNKEQLKAIVALKNTTVPAAMKAAKKIKTQELALADAILKQGEDPAKLDAMVDTIASERAALTKAHLRCIARMRQILSPEQFATLLQLASKKQ
jgi:hypothetical protein